MRVRTKKKVGKFLLILIGVSMFIVLVKTVIITIGHVLILSLVVTAGIYALKWYKSKETKEG